MTGRTKAQVVGGSGTQMMDVRSLAGYQGKDTVAAWGLNGVTEIEEAPVATEVKGDYVEEEGVFVER